jgi:putative acetyltransferase
MTKPVSASAADTMKIREFRSEDAAQTAELFRNTIRRVNSRDYSPEQVEVWASSIKDMDAWRFRLEAEYSFVSETSDGTLLGFIAMEPDGHIDLLYCHTDYQRQGIGSRLLSHVEKLARTSGITKLFTEASITARPFFENHGFVVLEIQEVRKRGVKFVNYRMEKRWRTSAPVFARSEATKQSRR